MIPSPDALSASSQFLTDSRHHEVFIWRQAYQPRPCVSKEWVITIARAKPSTEPSFIAIRHNPRLKKSVPAMVMPPTRIPSSQQRQANSNPACPAGSVARLAARYEERRVAEE